MLTLICSSTCVPSWQALRVYLTVSWIAQILLVYLYPGWPRRRCIVLTFSRRFHLCLVVSIDTNLFWFFLLMCFTIDQTSSSVSSLFWATLWTLLLLAWLFLILVGWYIYIFYLQNLSPHKGFGASFTFKLSTVDFQSNLTVTDRQVSYPITMILM